MNLEQAARLKYRFPSTKGALTVEQLWDLPLQSKTGFDLDTVARDINRELKEQAEDSFVTPANNTLKNELVNKLEIVVHVINTKQAENAALRDASARKAERERLNEILHMRTQKDLLDKSPAEIQAMIDALGPAS